MLNLLAFEVSLVLIQDPTLKKVSSYICLSHYRTYLFPYNFRLLFIISF